MKTEIYEDVKNQKGIYGFLGILCHFSLPFLFGFAIGHAFDSQTFSIIASVILFIWSMVLFQKSFRTTKANVISLAFVLGKCVGVLEEGLGYVPFGFLNGSTQDYTTAELSFEELITVEKMKILSDEDVKKAPHTYTFDDKTVLEYILNITLTGSFEVFNAYRFFKTTGLKEFKEVALTKKDHPFFKILMGDIESNFDTIAQKKGYSEFRKKTDWDISKIIDAGEAEDTDSLSLTERLDKFGLRFKKVATNTKFDKETEKILTDQLRADAQRGPDVTRAENKRAADEIAAEAEAFRIKKTKEAEANAEAYKVKTVGDATTTAVEKSINTYINIEKDGGYSLEASMQQASLDNNSYTNESINVLAGPGGKAISGLLTGAGLPGKDHATVLAGLAEKFGFTDKLEEFFVKLEKKTDKEKKDFLRKALTTK